MLYRFLILIIMSVLVLLNWQMIANSKVTEISDFTCLTADERDDESVSNELGVLTGQVTTINAKTREVEAPSSGVLIFQRVDCKKCIFQTRTDIKGKYEIIIGKGKYRVIVRDGTRVGETYDMLAPDQPRIIEVTASSIYTHFDINLVRRPNPLEEKEPKIIRNP